MRQKLMLLALACSLLIPAVSFAQETGSVSGAVFDSKAGVVAGATVKITGDMLPSGRTMVTTEHGLYTFTLLLPGKYSVDVEKTGIGKNSREVVVSVARDTQIDFILGSQITEAVTVTATAADVDLKSTEVGFNFTRDFMKDLPLDRSYLGMLQMIPGIADNGGFAPNGGGSRQDNTYLIDGSNITNPLFGYLGTEVNNLDIQEINVKRGAISAEFGRSAGFVTNAVSRSGTNRLSGNFQFEAIPSDWVKQSLTGFKSITDRWVTSFAVGGPIRKNSLFFYGSGRIFRSKTTRAQNPLVGTVPDRTDRTDEVFGKITAQLGSRSFVNAGYRHRPSKADNAGIGVTDAASVATNTEGTNRVATANWSWFFSSRGTLDVKALRSDEQSETVAVTPLPYQPTFDPANLTAMGRIVISGVGRGAATLKLNRQNYYRNEIKASISQFFDFGRTSHQIKAGFGFDDGVEELTRDTNGWGQISLVTVGGVQRYRANYYPTQGTQFGTGRTYSLFLQDNISMGGRLTLNLGVLLNRDQFIQEVPGVSSNPLVNVRTGTFLQFDFQDEVQPRLGFNYQLRKGKGDKVYANWGRYFGLEQKSTARALASGRLYTADTDFTLAGAHISTTPAANTTAKNIAAGIKAPFMDEIVVGYATPLGDGWSMDAFYMFRDTDNFIEDSPTVLPNSTYQYNNDFAADRKYKTFTVELNRSMRDRWSMNASYAWSKLYGNYDQDYSGGLGGAAVFNTSSLINDGPGSFTTDRFRTGVLSQDRTHVFKVLATWQPEWIENLSFGTVVRSQSGTPWEARGLPWGSSATYLRVLEQVGTNRNPMWTNVDLLVKYGVNIGSRRTLRLEGRLMNAFNQETALLVDQRKYLDGRILQIIGTPTPGCGSCYTDAYPQGTTQPNANYGKPTAYAAPRRFLLSLLFDF